MTMLSRMRVLAPAAFFAAVLIIGGCQGKGGNQTAPPTTPAPSGDHQSQAPVAAPDLSKIPESVMDADLTPGQGVFGANYLTIDLNRMSADLTPVRYATAIGDAFDVDIYEYLRKSPCGDCLQVQGLGYTGSEVEVQLA
ncbi:MAG: hypothetical protein ABI743_04600, partial [bacterium]